jgi:uncharacterized protein YhaN
LLVHFDDDRSVATLKLLAELGRSTQVLLFTHHRSVRDGVSKISHDSAKIIDFLALRRVASCCERRCVVRNCGERSSI